MGQGREGISRKCFCDILTDRESGFEVVASDGIRVILEKPGVDAAIILRIVEWYPPSVVRDWVELSGIGWEQFTRLKAVYCPD